MTLTVQHKHPGKIAISIHERFTFDQEATRSEKCDWVIGVDEVGRGSWVGPVITAAVCFYPQALSDPKVPIQLEKLNDSKKLRAEQRQTLAELLPKMGWTAIAEATQQEVETLNLHHASLLGLRRAIEGVLDQVNLNGHGLILVDGKFPLPDLEALATCHHVRLTQKPVIQGDGLSAAIGAASILAKTYRDALLTTLAQDYPGYGWEHNAGYGTPAHQRALIAMGPTELHRKTFKFMQTTSPLPPSLQRQFSQ